MRKKSKKYVTYISIKIGSILERFITTMISAKTLQTLKVSMDSEVVAVTTGDLL
jgi:hypothetical protein